MENLISIALDSIFVGNILLAYFLGMCSFLAISKNMQDGHRPRDCRDLRAEHHHAGQLADLQFSAGPRCPGLGRTARR